ncbi:MAG: tRNA (guanosine(37)-N1)-methyltransferase TrmD [Bacteroidales bacterium]|nr:tRNA (guanosine(37)-N1)-methyltransferase TrmD [Bacteroidales bacterium]
MRIDIITIFPEMFEGPFSHSIIKRAKEREKVEIYFHNPREYPVNKYGSIDDYPYGGGAGMVMRIEPVAAIIDPLLKERAYDEIIYTTPDSEQFNQQEANRLSTCSNIIILCGHYKGIDQRIRDIYVTKELSVGDYVLSGGELAAAVFTDAIVRLIPGVLGNETSALSDSFQDGLLAPPLYTKPLEYKGHKVPDILLSGNHQKIDEWRNEQAERITRERRPDLLK